MRVKMALIPLTAAFRQDFVVQLVPVEDSDTIDIVAQKVAAHAVDLRVAPMHAPMLVTFKGKRLSPQETVVSAGLGPMDYVEVGYADEQE
jgi:toluene monooxygenase system protein B